MTSEIARFIESAELDRPIDSDFKRFDNLEFGDWVKDMLLKSFEVWNTVNIPAALKISDRWCALVASKVAGIDDSDIKRIVTFSTQLSEKLYTCSTGVNVLSLGFQQIGYQYAMLSLRELSESLKRDRDDPFRSRGSTASQDPREVVERLERLLTGGDTLIRCKYQLNSAGEQIVETLKAVGPRVVQPIIQYLGEHKGDDKGFRHMVRLVEVLGRLGARQALPMLTQLLSLRTDEVGAAAVQAIADIGDPQSVGAICKRIQTSRPGAEADELLLSCMAALGKFGRAADEAVPLLISLVETRTDNIKMRSLATLGEVGGEAAATFLTHVRDAKRWLSFVRFGDSKYRHPKDMREAAHRAIATLRTVAAKPAPAAAPAADDMVRFTCSGCKKVLKASSQQAGKHGRCPKCQTEFVVPH